ncbi:MAG: hypothetical protein KDI14_10120 [Halioglobus sp.]|nr:hypothetical protein [Halioglobus sp.]
MKILLRICSLALLALPCVHGATAAGPGTEPGIVADVAVATPGAPNPAAIVELRFDEIGRYGELQLRWLTLDDSRCPTGSACVWAGQIAVTLEVVDPRQAAVEVKLLHPLRGQPAAVSALGCELRLLGVDPYPKEGREPARGDYRMQLGISCT